MVVSDTCPIFPIHSRANILGLIENFIKFQKQFIFLTHMLVWLVEPFLNTSTRDYHFVFEFLVL